MRSSRPAARTIPNQVNNVLGFPYIFRGALDVRATTINDAMKIAAAYAIAALAREDVPDEVSAAYRGQRLRYGPDYLIPTPFDPRLIIAVPSAVAQAAIEQRGRAQADRRSASATATQLRARLDPTASRMQMIIDRVRANPKRMVFAEGEEEKTIRAALAWRNNGLGMPVLIGREERIRETMARMGIAELPEGARDPQRPAERASNPAYAEFLYRRNQRRGLLFRDCQRLVNQDRNVFGACMVAQGDADAMVTGLTRNYIERAARRAQGDRSQARRARVRADHHGGARPHRVHRRHHGARAARPRRSSPTSRSRRRTPRAAWASRRGSRCCRSPTSATGASSGRCASQDAVEELDRRHVDFEYDGEMSVDVALDPELMALYPFCRLSGPANVLIMPALHTAHISSQAAEAAGRRHRDRTAAARAEQAGADPADERLGIRDDQSRGARRSRRDRGRGGAHPPGGGVTAPAEGRRCASRALTMPEMHRQGLPSHDAGGH